MRVVWYKIWKNVECDWDTVSSGKGDARVEMLGCALFKELIYKEVS